MTLNDLNDPRYTATAGEIDRLDDEAAVEELLTGESSTVADGDLPQEFDDLADAAEHGDLDRDDERLARKEHELEERDLTDVDEEGLEGSLKSLHFEEAEGEDHVDPQATRPDAPHRKG